MRAFRAPPARLVVLVLGLGYLVIAGLESVAGRLDVGGATLLELATALNLVHWTTGLTVVGASIASEQAARLAARGAVLLFVVLSVAAFAARDWTGDLLGFAGPVPWAYPILHLVTALLALMGAALVPPVRRP